MKAILGIGIFVLAIWLALGLLAGQAEAQFPWGNPDYWGSPYGGYSTEYIQTLGYTSVYNMYDPYGQWAAYAGYSPRDNYWGYGQPGGLYGYGQAAQNPYW